MSRLFTYIGWAKNLDERSHKHTTHYGLESIVFGLFSAVVKYLFGLEFQITRTVLFYATSGVHAGITEILGHAMASGYLELGGFNHSWAGGRGSGAGLDTEEVTQQVDLHKEMILKSGHVEENLMQNDEKLERLTFACDEDAQEQLWSETAEAQIKCLQRAEESEKSVEKTHTSVLLADFQTKMHLEKTRPTLEVGTSNTPGFRAMDEKTVPLTSEDEKHVQPSGEDEKHVQPPGEDEKHVQPPGEDENNALSDSARGAT
ncbi:hypothetical protein HRR78_000853 [Exophiala dermatitidis]|nr:hypothetical protein HRR75_001758 [Exophiala dermatitidis]KAJ4560326.1 hypothetical protein HRR78_000853 [Exophiala dermatitidis]